MCFSTKITAPKRSPNGPAVCFRCELDARDFRGLDYEAAQRQAKDQAERLAESQIFEAIEENLPDDEEGDWNWEALAKFANSRWKTNLRDRDLKKAGRDSVTDLLMEQARAIDRAGRSVRRRPLLGCRSQHPHRLRLGPIQIRPANRSQRSSRFGTGAVQGTAAQQSPRGLRRERGRIPGAWSGSSTSPLAIRRAKSATTANNSWPGRAQRFGVELDSEEVKNKERDDIRALLVQHSRSNQVKAADAHSVVQRQIDAIFSKSGGDHAHTNGSHTATGVAVGKIAVNGEFDGLIAQLKKYDPQMPVRDVEKLDREQLEAAPTLVVDDHFRPEMRRMERALVLQILDAAWKDHLLAMDHLRSSVQFRGYAQVDPKVEFKREGMRTFEIMWASIGDRVTDLIFRMEQLDENFIGSTWKETAAVHESAPSPTDISQQQQAAIEGSQGQAQKMEPIRNRGERVGRNEPCPCGSGKKYKNCCMRKQQSRLGICWHKYDFRRRPGFGNGIPTMAYLLNVIYGLVLLLATPWLVFQSLFRGKYRSGFAAKFLGAVPVRVGEQPCIWFHAVSVGEVNLLAVLLRAGCPSSGPMWNAASPPPPSPATIWRSRNTAEHTVFYCPLDFSWAVRRAMRRIRPSLLVLAELELWPNLIRAANEHGAKVAIVNGRLSERSFRGYHRIRRWLRSTLDRIDCIAVQTAEYAERFRALGAASDRVTVTGSLKFDGATADRNNPRTQKLRELAGIRRDDIVFLAGSTQDPEERLGDRSVSIASRRFPAPATDHRPAPPAPLRRSRRPAGPQRTGMATPHAPS